MSELLQEAVCYLIISVQKKIRMWVFFHGYKRDKNWIDNDHEKDPLPVAFASDSNARSFLLHSGTTIPEWLQELRKNYVAR